MKNYAIPLLLHLSLNSLVSAEVPTFTQREGGTYIGNVADDRGLEPNDIIAEDTGDLRITLGPELSQKVVQVAKENCNDPESDDCKKRMEEVLGIGPEANGLQKRVIGLIPVLGVLAFSYITYKILSYKGELWGNTEGFKVVDFKIPKDQKEEVSGWDISDENKFMYKPTDSDAVEVSINNAQPKPKHPVTFEKNEAGDVTVGLPGMVTWITDAWDAAGCGRTGMKRSLDKRVTMLVCLITFYLFGCTVNSQKIKAIQTNKPTGNPKMLFCSRSHRSSWRPSWRNPIRRPGGLLEEARHGFVPRGRQGGSKLRQKAKLWSRRRRSTDGAHVNV
jgi:hypothetical protein